MSRTIIDLHILQTVPPSNINRDDTGSPKTAVYGGVRRARVSSQAWKRATRTEFGASLDSSDLGQRTKRVVDLVAARIKELAPELADTAEQAAIEVFKAAGIKVEKPKPKKDQPESPAEATYLLFLSNTQVRALAQLAVDAARGVGTLDKAAVKKAAQSQHSIDLALFGRMVAEAPDLNVDACCQVAHAISVHGVDNEFDYFTAVDDKAPADNAGAGMIGTVEFNSSTLYRYATIDVDALTTSLGDTEAAGRAVEAFIRAFVTSMPTGKQNTFANRTLPDAVVAFVQDHQPVNLVGAFEEAVIAEGSNGRIAVAAQRLAEHASAVEEAFSQPAVAGFVVSAGAKTTALEKLGTPGSLDALVSGVGTLVRERVAGR